MSIELYHQENSSKNKDIFYRGKRFIHPVELQRKRQKLITLYLDAEKHYCRTPTAKELQTHSGKNINLWRYYFGQFSLFLKHMGKSTKLKEEL